MYKVFICDDEPFIVEGLFDAVDWSAFGLEVVGSAENGVQALERLRVAPADILITDISMPQMNGLELIRLVREFRPELKVIVLSGYNEFNYLKEGMRLGIENYLLKPVHFGELSETLAATVGKLNASPLRSHEWSEDEIGILRDNVMLRWLHGRIGAPELAERAALLRIELNRPFVAVAAVRADGGTAAADPDRVFAVAERFVAGDEGAVPFRDLDDRTLIAFLFDEAEAGKRAAVRRLEALAAEWTARGGPGVPRIVIGSAEPQADARLSYERALGALELFVVAPDRVFLDYDRLPIAKEAGAAPEERWLELAAYEQALEAKDGEALVARVDRDAERLRALGEPLPAGARGAAIELIIRMKMEEDRLGRSERPEAYKAAIDQALAADTPDELAKAVKDAASAVVRALRGDDMSPVIRQVLRHVQEHYAEPMTLKTLGQQFNIHPVYLGHLFHKQTGDNFTDYLNQYRIGKAKELLRDSSLKVNEIARTVGYWETGYFYKQFKKFVGVPPSEYKGLL